MDCRKLAHIWDNKYVRRSLQKEGVFEITVKLKYNSKAKP